MIWQIINPAWNVVPRWIRVFWVCRVSLISASLGVALFLFAGPARDLFMEDQGYDLYWIAYFFLVFYWALIVHYSARKVLEQQAWAASGKTLPLNTEDLVELREKYRLPAAWVPRLLGFSCLGAISLGILGAAADLDSAKQKFLWPDPTRLLWYLSVATLVYIAYLVVRRRVVNVHARHQPWSDYLRDFATGRGGSLLIEPAPLWFVDLALGDGRRARPSASHPTWDRIALVLLGFLASFWLVCLFRPSLVEIIAPRAQFVIFMLGLPVALLALLSAVSHRLRFPLIATLALTFFILTGLTPTFHELRALSGQRIERVVRVDLKDAVDRWVRANCNLPPDAEAVPCGARPVILASAGGASRAAFFTASVIGDMLDDGSIGLQRRLFAISGVSGGSVGAVMIKAALKDAGPDGKAPCKNVSSSWFRYWDKSEVPYSWRECLQALASGDFLSRPLVGLIFRDVFGFPLHFLGMDDRTILLEQAFEDQYSSLVSSVDRSEGGLKQAIGDSTPTSAPWVPLLLLNTTSALDGRRSIISDLLPFWCKDNASVPIFPAAVDLHETLGTPRGCIGDEPLATSVKPVRAVRLSTGATASARFPVVSPHAVVRADKPDDSPNAVVCTVKKGVVDQLVDGGYFENDGLTTARELAAAMLAVQPKLAKPVIIHVTNNPTSESEGIAVVPPRSFLDTRWYDTIGAPLRALLGTRDGHAAEATHAAACSPAVAQLISFQVYDTVPQRHKDQSCSLNTKEKTSSTEGVGSIKTLSMSWWLSGAVQAYLDRQLCHHYNTASFFELADMMDTSRGFENSGKPFCARSSPP